MKRSRGKPRVIDGPFAESKEPIAGHLLLQVESREEAIERARRGGSGLRWAGKMV